MPRQLIPCDGNFSDDSPLALVVEEAEDAPEPCDYLDAATVYYNGFHFVQFSIV